MTDSREIPHTRTPRMTSALLDGLVTFSGLLVATGSFFNAEIMMWWAGA